MRTKSTITEVAKRYGLTLRTLRFYEQKGLISPTREGTARYYSPQDCERIELVLKGKNLGFALDDILKMIEEKARARDKTKVDFMAKLDLPAIEKLIVQLERRREDLSNDILDLKNALERPREG